MHGPCSCVWDWGSHLMYIFIPVRSELERGFLDHLFYLRREIFSTIVQYDSPGGGWHNYTWDLH